jgi:6,7-dimethyl-8-ribityllumazine synthase
MSDWRRPATDDGDPSQGGLPSMQGALDARQSRVVLVASMFNHSIVAKLIEGAGRAWVKHGGAIEKLLVVRVPGAFELPVTALHLANSKNYDAVVALGCLIRGDTPHFEYVAGQCASGLQRVACDTGVPVVFGVLTVETATQAEERASLDHGNKGAESMEVALEMAGLLAKLR